MDKKRNFIISRKDFLKQSALLGVSLSVPGFILSACSGTIIGGDSGTSSHYASFELTFSKQMDKTSVENALSVTPNEASFSGKSFEWSGNTKFYCKLPCDSAGKNYNITIAETAKDDVGISLDGDDDGNAGGQYLFSITSV